MISIIVRDAMIFCSLQPIENEKSSQSPDSKEIIGTIEDIGSKKFSIFKLKNILKLIGIIGKVYNCNFQNF